MEARILRLGRVSFDPRKQMQEHTHSFFQVCYVLRGRGYVGLNGDVYELNPGDVHFYYPGWSHDFRVRPRSEFETLDMRFLVFNKEIVEIARDIPPFVKAGTYSERIADILLSIENIGMQRHNPLWKQAGHAYIKVLLYSLLQSAQQYDMRNKTQLSPIPMKALSLMKESLPQGISVARLAERLYVSSTHLTTLLKAEFGKTAQELMVHLKVNHSKQDLVTSARPVISKIARHYGWQDARYFRRHFKDVTGMSPQTFSRLYSNYRRTHGTYENWIVFDSSVKLKWESPSTKLDLFGKTF